MKGREGIGYKAGKIIQQSICIHSIRTHLFFILFIKPGVPSILSSPEQKWEPNHKQQIRIEGTGTPGYLEPAVYIFFFSFTTWAALMNITCFYCYCHVTTFVKSEWFLAICVRPMLSKNICSHLFIFVRINLFLFAFIYFCSH